MNRIIKNNYFTKLTVKKNKKKMNKNKLLNIKKIQQMKKYQKNMKIKNKYYIIIMIRLGTKSQKRNNR